MLDINFSDFNKIYKESIFEILPHIKDNMIEELSVHNKAWKGFDFKTYLEKSVYRYYPILKSFSNILNESKKIFDVGSLFPVFPMTLKKIGFNCSISESLKYYGPMFLEMFNFIEKKGIQVIDYDPFIENNNIKGESFDIIMLMAVLEHYPYSPKHILENLKFMMSDNSYLYIEVPNLAYLPNRIKFLKGKSLAVPMELLYDSAVPFTGHHREYVYQDLVDISKKIGLEIEFSNFYNYSDTDNSIKHIIKYFYKYILFSLFKETRECISVSLKKKK